MYIIIVGGGHVGYHLSKALLNEGHEILVIETDIKQVRYIEEELGSICIQGDGCEVSILEEAGTERANLLIAVTGKDEDNLVACQIAKHKFNVPRTISRLSNPKNDTLFKKLGIDTTVSSVNLILEHIEEEIPTHPLTHLLSLRNGDLELIEVKVPVTSSIIGKGIDEVSLPGESMISLVIRKEQEVRTPAADVTIEAEDRLVVVTKPELEEDLRIVLTSS